MPVMKLISPSSITSYLPLTNTFPNTIIWSSVKIWILKYAKMEIINLAFATHQIEMVAEFSIFIIEQNFSPHRGFDYMNCSFHRIRNTYFLVNIYLSFLFSINLLISEWYRIVLIRTPDSFPLSPPMYYQKNTHFMPRFISLNMKYQKRITELSQQRFAKAYIEVRNKQVKLHNMTGHHLPIGI